MRRLSRLFGSSSLILLRGLLIGLVVVLMSVGGLMEGLERWALSAQFKLRGPLPPISPVVIVAIGEDSFDELDLAWPWPRALHGQFLDLISQGRPAVVGFDLILSEPSSRGPDDDQALADALGRAGSVILASAMMVTLGETYVKEDMNAPIGILRRNAAGFGFANFETDEDAFIRRTELTRVHQNKEIPSFDLQVYLAAVKAGIVASSIQAQSFLINFRGGPKTFPTIPYYQVLTGEVPLDTFTGKIVLVGATSPILQDLHPTAFASHGDMPGVEVHANVLETLLQGVPLLQTPRFLTALFALVAAVLAVWLTNRLRPLAAMGVLAGLALGFAAVAFLIFLKGRLVIDVVAVPLALAVGYGATVVENFIHEQRQKLALMQLFSKHVSPEVADAIWQQRGEFMTGGRLRSQKLIATVLFTDLKGFTSISERMDTPSLMDWINAYMEVMAQLVMKYGGVVDDYFGDAIKANFGVPFARTTQAEMQQDAANAVDCALAMETELKRMNVLWKEQGLPTVGMRVGIFTGEVTAGCLGSAQRLKYTTIGDTVNTASRLESFEKDLEELAQTPCRILIGEQTLQCIGERYKTQRVGELSLKGKDKKVPVYRVFGNVEGSLTLSRVEEARKHRRVNVAVAVLVSDGLADSPAVLADLSAGGLSVAKLPSELVMGKLADLQFELPGGASPLRVIGKVVWTSQDRAGFAFVNPGQSDRVAIEQFILQQGAQGLIASISSISSS